MKRSILVTWTCSEQVDLDIPDSRFTDDEIEGLIGKAAKAIMPQDPDDWEWAWIGREAIAKDTPFELPPDDCWIESKGYTAATDGDMIITKNCPIDVGSPLGWRKLESSDPIDSLLSVDFTRLPLHCGWFKRRFDVFKDFKVVGNTPGEGLNGNACLGYVLDDSGKLIAVLMPANYTPDDRDPNFYFQFNFNVRF